MSDKLAQALAQFESIKEMVDALNAADNDGDNDAREAAERTILEDPLSVEVRSGWYTPGHPDKSPEEYQILLCTGGPACRIVGQLDEYCQPISARMEVQDWFTPWTDFAPHFGPDNSDGEPIMLAYARCFYFGE